MTLKSYLTEKLTKEMKTVAMAGNRTRVNCLEGSYAHHYTTIAEGWRVVEHHPVKHLVFGIPSRVVFGMPCSGFHSRSMNKGSLISPHVPK